MNRRDLIKKSACVIGVGLICSPLIASEDKTETFNGIEYLCEEVNKSKYCVGIRPFVESVKPAYKYLFFGIIQNSKQDIDNAISEINNMCQQDNMYFVIQKIELCLNLSVPSLFIENRKNSDILLVYRFVHLHKEKVSNV